MAKPEKGNHFLIAKDGLHSDSESGDYDVDEIAREVAQRRETVSRYRQSTEESQLIGRQSKNTRNHVNRVYASLLTTRSFSCIICFVSLLALALLVASTIILCIRPYPWRKELISMVFVVMSSAAIVVSKK
jgi:multidrug efflux pump subunit AcrB